MTVPIKDRLWRLFPFKSKKIVIKVPSSSVLSPSLFSFFLYQLCLYPLISVESSDIQIQTKWHNHDKDDIRKLCNKLTPVHVESCEDRIMPCQP